MKTKHCSKCKQTLEIVQFNLKGLTSAGEQKYQPLCIESFGKNK